jgi:hypothetical protein
MNPYLEWLAVFVGMFLLDAAYTRYTQAITSGNPLRAAHFAAVLIGITAFVTVSYVQNRWLTIPVMAGAWAGTWVAVKWPPRGN